MSASSCAATVSGVEGDARQAGGPGAGGGGADRAPLFGSPSLTFPAAILFVVPEGGR